MNEQFSPAVTNYQMVKNWQEWNPLLASLNARLTTQMLNPLRKVAKAP